MKIAFTATLFESTKVTGSLQKFHGLKWITKIYRKRRCSTSVNNSSGSDNRRVLEEATTMIGRLTRGRSGEPQEVTTLNLWQEVGHIPQFFRRAEAVKVARTGASLSLPPIFRPSILRHVSGTRAGLHRCYSPAHQWYQLIYQS